MQISNFNQAADHLMSTSANIEFRLEKQNFCANAPKLAVKHLKTATTHFHPRATFNLGVCYETGFGIEKNMENAMKCYRIVAKRGHKDAMYNLGRFFGLEKNRKAAREYLKLLKQWVHVKLNQCYFYLKLNQPV